jgi:amino acid adenylation domain-containing protein
VQYLVHQLLPAAAERRPNHVAVIDGKRSVTYSELDARSNQVAHLLQERGVERGDRVGLYLDKSIESLVGIYGALKAGAAYVPLDPGAPPRRLGYIASNCGIEMLLTATAKEDAWEPLHDAGTRLRDLVVLDAPTSETHEPTGLAMYGSDAVDALPTSAPTERAISLDLAYILYTSGSTGDPKGVMLSHRNALAFVEWAAEEFDVTAEDRLSSHAPLHFDLSVFDLFAAARGAATVVLVPPKTSMFPTEVARFMREQEISVWYSVPSILSMLTLRGGLRTGDVPSLRVLLFAGEVFPTKYLRQLMALLPHARFANLYGPTETNVCTWYEVPPLPEGQDEPIPIGKAIADDEVFAVTDEGHRAEPGEVGELYVRGATVMRGYWADPDRTAERLVPDPSRAEFQDPVDRAGDLVSQDIDGNWRYLGRRDAQIKSRGYRIELGEIEAALYAHPGVEECAVVAVADDLVTNRIKAFVVVKGGLRSDDLTATCAERLPRYMIPETFIVRQRLPKTSTGKIDRQALQAEAR